LWFLIPISRKQRARRGLETLSLVQGQKDGRPCKCQGRDEKS
jgi:hypothetical protein